MAHSDKLPILGWPKSLFAADCPAMWHFPLTSSRRVPLQNRTAKSQVAKTDLQLKQIQAQLHTISLNLESVVTNIYIQIQELEQVLTLNQEQIQSAKAKTEEELKLYNRGRGELTFVIQSQDSEQNAKLTYAQNALTYHRLILEYRALLDELLPLNSQE